MTTAQHPAEQQEDVVVKRAAYAQYPIDIQAYKNSKNEWIKQTEKLALAWLQKQLGH